MARSHGSHDTHAPARTAIKYSRVGSLVALRQQEAWHQCAARTCSVNQLMRSLAWRKDEAVRKKRSRVVRVETGAKGPKPTLLTKLHRCAVVRYGNGAHRTMSEVHRDTHAFALQDALDRVRSVVQALPPAALFQLAEEGYRSPFELLVACMISVRTRDEVTVPTARRLFARARTPQEFAALDPNELARLLRPASFAAVKAQNLMVIARRLLVEQNDTLLCNEEFLRSLPGVGPKCTNLVLGIACGIPRVAVDVHVHRIVNRWGYVRTRTPEQTMQALEQKLPQQYWVELNRLLVPFGKHVCTGIAPRCSICVLADLCPHLGVTHHR